MRRPLVLLVIILLASPAYAAHFKGWIKGYIGEGWVLGEYVVPVDDGIVVAGRTTDTPSGGWGVFVMKFDREGNVEWSKVWEARSDVYAITGVVIDSKGRIYVAGILTNVKSKKDGFIVAFSPEGQLLWQKLIKTDKDDFLSSIAVGSDGLYVAGSSEGLEFETGTVASAFLAKFDAGGNPVWVKAYENGYYTAFDSVALMRNKVFVSGRIAIPGECDVLRARVWLVRLSSNGNIELQKMIKAPSVKTLLSFNGNILGAAGSTLFVMDEEGNVKWARNLKLHHRQDIYSVSASRKGLVVTTEEGELLLLTPDGKPLRGMKLSFYPYTGGENIARGFWEDDHVIAVGTFTSERDHYDKLLVLKLPTNFPYGNMIRPLGKVESSPVEFKYLGAPEVEVRDAGNMLKVLNCNGTLSEWAPETVWMYPWARLEVIVPSFGAFVRLKSKHYSVDFAPGHSVNLTVLPDTYNISVTPQIPGSFKLQEFNTTVSINPGDELVLYVDFETGKAYLRKVNENTTTPQTSTEGTTSTISKTESRTTGSTARSEGTSSTPSEKSTKDGGICGPVAIIAVALLPLLRKR